MDTTQLVRQNFPIEYTPLSRGHIAGVVELVAGKPKQKASVTAFTDLLLVLLPNASSEALYGPCKWGAIHGARLPAVGAEVQVGVDETNHPVVLWWEGEEKNTAEPSGTAGGALAGTYPNPTLAAPEAFKQASALEKGFEHEWVNFEAARKAEYRKNPLGTVELRGVIKAGKEGESAFILPPGYRPKEEKNFLQSAQTAEKFGRIMVASSGAVVPEKGTGETKVFVYLELSFSVE